MPAEWSERDGNATLTLRPHRSLPARGFVWVIGLTATGVGLPVLAVVGRSVLWGLLPFAVAAVWALWAALAHTNRAASLVETLNLTPDALTLTRHDPGRPDRVWRANPYWVQVRLRDGPVPDYLTLAAEGKEKELGAFLTPAERREIDVALRARLRALKAAAQPPGS